MGQGRGRGEAYACSIEGLSPMATQKVSTLAWLTLAVISSAVIVWGCGSEHGDVSVQYVSVGPSTTLEVIDWGGSGAPLVFLAGLGHTAHVFDEFAPFLTDKYWVLGITRRGFGASTQPDSGYDIPTLAEDIRTVLDSLHIERATLIGHSLGGDEMTFLARRYPDRVAALVYIEAAYRRATARDSLARYVAPESQTPLPTTEDRQSATSYREYYARVNGVPMPISEIKAMYHWHENGTYRGSVTPFFVYESILASIDDPDYSEIHIPSLAIYATNYPVTELFIDYNERDSLVQSAMKAYHEAALRIDKLSREYFRAHMSNGRVVEISGAGHSLYITHRQEVLEYIRAFLAGLL